MPRLTVFIFFNLLFTDIFMNREGLIRPVPVSTDRNWMAPGFAKVTGDKNRAGPSK